MSAPVAGRLDAVLTGLGPVDGTPLAPGERQRLGWLACLPALTPADLVALVRQYRTETTR